MFIKAIASGLVILTQVPSSIAQGCYSSLREIDMKEFSLIQDANYDSSVLPPRSNVLCPDTMIPIGSGDYFDNWQGEFPLVIFNPNVHIRCGESGSSENKCTLFGGETQLAGLGISDLPDSNLPDSNIVPDTSNFTIQGVTFKNATGTSVNFEIQGEAVMIQDCLFSVR